MWLQRLLQRLVEIRPGGLAQHHLILGQRGMGKTSLLRRLALAIRDDPALSAVLLPLCFREEQYNVHNLRIFWGNCLDALADWFEKAGRTPIRPTRSTARSRSWPNANRTRTEMWRSRASSAGPRPRASVPCCCWTTSIWC